MSIFSLEMKVQVCEITLHYVVDPGEGFKGAMVSTSAPVKDYLFGTFDT